MNNSMSPEQITSLGEVAAKAANRAIQKASTLGYDQNRGQFVSMVKTALQAIPIQLRGHEASEFLVTYADSAYPQR